MTNGTINSWWFPLTSLFYSFLIIQFCKYFCILVLKNTADVNKCLAISIWIFKTFCCTFLYQQKSHQRRFETRHKSWLKIFWAVSNACFRLWLWPNIKELLFPVCSLEFRVNARTGRLGDKFHLARFFAPPHPPRTHTLLMESERVWEATRKESSIHICVAHICKFLSGTVIFPS